MSGRNTWADLQKAYDDYKAELEQNQEIKQMTLIERYQKECQQARQTFKDTGSKYHEGYADAFDIAEQMYEEKMSKREESANENQQGSF